MDSHMCSNLKFGEKNKWAKLKMAKELKVINKVSGKQEFMKDMIK